MPIQQDIGTLLAERGGAYEVGTFVMVTLRDSFDEVLERYHQAQKEFVRGNPQPFKALCSHADDVTIIGGWGGIEKGWSAQVEKRYDWASTRFASDDDERRVENISTVVSPEIAYTVDIERTKIRLAGTQDVRPMALRVTSIFRQEDGQWKLVHRHADPLVEVQSAVRSFGNRGYFTERNDRIPAHVPFWPKVTSASALQMSAFGGKCRHGDLTAAACDPTERAPA